MTPLLLLALREDLAPTWEKVATTIRQSYYARRARHAEMERLLAKYAPRAKAAASHPAFRDVVDAMIDEFGDSHFELLTDAEQGYYLMDGLRNGAKAETMPQIGAWFRHSPDGYTVTMVLEGGAAERAGLRPGDVVTRVDGRPFSPVEALREDVGKNVSLIYLRNGQEAGTTADVKRSPAIGMFLDATLASRRTLQANGRRFGYLHLWTQTTDDFAKLLAQTVRDAKGDDGFVLDLRGGFGGHPSGYATPFAKGAFDGPLAVIVDHGSRSAKEVLSYELQTSGRATIVGETTAGAVLGTNPVRINDWAYLELPVSDVRLGGVRLEKKGVTPDVPVSPGEDPIARAVAYLSTKRIKV